MVFHFEQFFSYFFPALHFTLFFLILFYEIFELFLFLSLSDLLRTDTEGTDRPDSARTQKACDTDNLSDYNKLAKTGGHKGKFQIHVLGIDTLQLFGGYAIQYTYSFTAGTILRNYTVRSWVPL